MCSVHQGPLQRQVYVGRQALRIQRLRLDLQHGVLPQRGIVPALQHERVSGWAVSHPVHVHSQQPVPRVQQPPSKRHLHHPGPAGRSRELPDIVRLWLLQGRRRVQSVRHVLVCRRSVQVRLHSVGQWAVCVMHQGTGICLVYLGRQAIQCRRLRLGLPDRAL